MCGGGRTKGTSGQRRERGTEREKNGRAAAPSPLTSLPRPHSRARAHSQAKFFGTAVAIAKAHKAECDKKGLKKIVEFRASLQDGDNNTWPEALRALKAQVLSFARSFPVVGFDEKTAKY